jgi:hypothetical protein
MEIAMSDATSWITAIAAVITALYVFLTWRSYKNIEWFTGSMENYEAVKLRLEALKAAGIEPEFVWWDPTVGGHPKIESRAHGNPILERKIYLYVPRRERAVQFNLLWSMNELKNQLGTYFGKLKIPTNWKS